MLKVNQQELKKKEELLNKKRGALLPFFVLPTPEVRFMIFGIGNDIIEVARIKRAIEKDNGFREKVFSPREIELCESKGNKYQSYAARFAAKEAFMKALKTGWADGVTWTEIEVLNSESGAPYLNLLNKTEKLVIKENIQHLHISLSHLKEYAIAQVILEL